MKSYEWKQQNGLIMFTIKRAEKRNAINYEVMNGLKEAIQRAKKEDIKGLIISGEGDKAFCSGGDLSVFHNLKTEEEAFEMLSKMGGILYNLLMLPKPTVALLNGIALGGGCELAAACDFRVARKGIKAGFIQGNLSITTGWGGGSILLEKLPLSNAMKMLFEAKRYSTEELLELGFIQSVYEGDPMEGFRSTVGEIFQFDVGVLQAYKEMMIRKWQEIGIQKKMEQEIRRCAALWQRDEHHNKVNQFLNRSK